MAAHYVRRGGSMLHLAAPTRANWVDDAVAHVDTILIDHAHCEKKAASTALTLIFRYGDRVQMMVPLADLAREELEHFTLVLGILEDRGVPFGKLRPAPYAGKLLKAVRSTEPERLVDTLLCCALIEARSCERMKLLSEHLPEADLAEMYRGLLASEARHHQLYVDLALTVAPRDVVRARLTELATHEAAVLSQPGNEPRVHS